MQARFFSKFPIVLSAHLVAFCLVSVFYFASPVGAENYSSCDPSSPQKPKTGEAFCADIEVIENPIAGHTINATAYITENLQIQSGYRNITSYYAQGLRIAVDDKICSYPLSGGGEVNFGVEITLNCNFVPYGKQTPMVSLEIDADTTA